MRLLGFMVAVLLGVLAGAPSALAQAGLDFGRYVALVIGNNDYLNLPKLKTAVADARAVADLLRTRYDFQVELLLNGDRDAIIRAVNGYRAKLRDTDSFLIYYAGHGLIDEATDRGFWLPTDADKEIEARWIDVAVISSNLRAMQARHILVVADSCYSGSLVRAADQAGIPTGSERTLLLQRMRERRARVALTSGSLEPVVDSGGSGHSVFAGALLALLRENPEIISASELFARLRARVVANAQQTPLYSDIRFAGHEGGDFIFVPRGVTLATAPAPVTASDAQAALELAFWNSIKDSAAADDYQAYLEAFPSGRFAPLARRRVEVAMAARPAGPVAAARPNEPAPSPPAPKIALAPSTPAAAPAATPPSPSAPPPAVVDAASLQRQWSTISLALRRQYDRAWARHDEAYHLNSINGYRLIAVTPDEVTISLEFVAQSTTGGYSGGYPRTRTREVRFRNRAPGFAILQWGALRADTSVTNAAQIDIHWDAIRERIVTQYDREIAAADGAFDMAEIGNYRVDRLNAEEIALTIDYVVNPSADAANRSRSRTVEVRLRNRSPDFRIMKWGGLPPLPADDADASPQRRLAFADLSEAQQFWPIVRRALERQYADSIRFRPTESIAGIAGGPPAVMLIKRHAMTSLQNEQLTVAITYAVSGGGNAERDRDATVTLRNAGPAFEVLEWRR